MAVHEFHCESGNVYQCEVPELTVGAARARLAIVQGFRGEQLRLENRVRLIDRYYDSLADSGDVDDLDEALEKLEDAGRRSREATAAAAAYADSKVFVEFFCDGIEGVEFIDLPPADASELHSMCRAMVMGTQPSPPVQAG